MKKLFFLIYFLLLLIACISQKPERRDIKFIGEAAAKAKKANRLLVVEFPGSDTIIVQRLNKDIFENYSCAAFIQKNFEFIKVKASDPAYIPLVKHLNISNENSVIFFDQNGNEIDRTVSYDGNKEAYLEYIKDISTGKNLYGMVLSAYEKGPSDAGNCYLMAEKLRFRNRTAEAIDLYRKVLTLDTLNKYRLFDDCKSKIAKVSGKEGVPSEFSSRGSY